MKMEASKIKTTLIAIRSACNKNEVGNVRELYKLVEYKNTHFYTYLIQQQMLSKDDNGFYKMTKKLNINLEFAQNIIDGYRIFRSDNNTQKTAKVIDLHPAAKVIPLNPNASTQEEPLLLNTSTNAPIVEEHENEEIQVVSEGFSQTDEYLQSRELPDFDENQTKKLDEFEDQLFPENTNTQEEVAVLKEVITNSNNKKAWWQRVGDWLGM